MSLQYSSREWVPVCAALCLLLLMLFFPQTSREPFSTLALSASARTPSRPLAPEPTDAAHVEAPPFVRTPAPRRPVEEEPWEFNHALQGNGTTATGGSRPELLIDGNITVYDGATGYAHTNWPTKPPPPFILTFRQGVRLNAVRFLLWDGDSRFYRYKLEASSALARDEWVILADRTDRRTSAAAGRSWSSSPYLPVGSV
jgi:hypothetical protein